MGPPAQRKSRAGGVEGISVADAKLITDDLFGGGVLGVSDSGFGVPGVSSLRAAVQGVAKGQRLENVGVSGQIMP